MNKDIKYIYPVSRVSSIEKLLRTTAHNAFFVVTPLITEEEQREQSEINPEAAFTPNIEMTRKTWQHRRRQNSFHTSLTAKHEEREQQQETGLPLVLHGIILRSQLVTLLKNRAFFKELDGVGYYCLASCLLHWLSCVLP